ncbi:MAG: hypothetical protein ACYTDW_19100, partial [Planctomycetota bacterium]
MKKIVLTLIVLLFATPAWADVNISAVQVDDTNEVIISWTTVSEPNLVRAFGLDIVLDNDANILEVVAGSPDYWVYPGRIQINAQGQVTYQGTMDAEYADLPSDTQLGIDSNGVTLEAASLYAPVGIGSPNAPNDFGDLASVYVSKSCTLCVSANISRAGSSGVVMEDPDQAVTVNYPAVCLDVVIPEIPVECMKDTHPAYADWLTWGKPDCWCYARQCRGDGDGVQTGPFWVGFLDLNAFVAAFNKLDAQLPAGGICYDADHV